MVIFYCCKRLASAGAGKRVGGGAIAET